MNTYSFKTYGFGPWGGSNTAKKRWKYLIAVGLILLIGLLICFVK